jgi:hypothetical protein
MVRIYRINSNFRCRAGIEFTIKPGDFVIKESPSDRYFRVENDSDGCIGVVRTGDYNAVIEF